MKNLHDFFTILQKHPGWQRSEGAVGITESLAEAGGLVIETMIVPNEEDDFSSDLLLIV